MDLKGKTALVCGASQGIGKSVCFALAELGARIILLSRREEELLKVKSQLPNSDIHQTVASDLYDLPKLLSSIEQMLREVGSIEILVGNSGGPKAGPLLEAAPEEFLKAFHEHILANHLLAQLLVPSMVKSKYGRIINIVSTSVKSTIPNLGVSNTIRAAVTAWAKTLSKELGSAGITVNNVLPGYTQTPRLDSLIVNSANKRGCKPEVIDQELKSKVPLGRYAHPDETAAAIAFLASSKAGYINGINLPVDGGRLDCL